ncbi:hypothetical protein BT93_L1049 [Corymbia citriodora subsp. variegata]|uniref:Uncharacterized protein n=1 Tax=Corymbia citriodora subsp. variegata TaxID=360336 RepID=A0A8T0CSI9_CORYI|nr:hypothetical protein BT93_L1049 [Corymbia citriodora subsp. variegata]
MAQEDQTQKCSNSSSGGNITIASNNSIRSSKKQKQKKVPQRGLGVAQLEKIRIEEQQKRDAATIFPSPAAISQSSSCYLPAPLVNYHVQGDFAPPNSIFRPVAPHPVQNFEVPSAGAFPLVNRARGCSLEIDRQSGAMIVPEHFPYILNFPEYGGEIKTSLADPGSQLCSRPSLPNDSGWPSLGPVRKLQYDHPTLLDVSAGECITSYFFSTIPQLSDGAPFKPKSSWQLFPSFASGREDDRHEEIMSLLSRKSTSPLLPVQTPCTWPSE